MPTDHRVRLDDDQVLFPAWPEPEQRYPEGAIQRSELGLRPSLGVRRELLLQGKLDDCLVSTTSKKAAIISRRTNNEDAQVLW